MSLNNLPIKYIVMILRGVIMNNVLSSDAIALKKGANIKIREWYLNNVKTNNKLFVPSLNNVVCVPYVKESSKEEVIKL